MKKVSSLVLCLVLLVPLLTGCGTSTPQATSSSSKVSVPSSSSAPPTPSSSSSSTASSPPEAISTPESVPESTDSVASTDTSETLFTKELELQEISFVLEDYVFLFRFPQTETAGESIEFVYGGNSNGIRTGKIIVLPKYDNTLETPDDVGNELTLSSILSAYETKEEIDKSDVTIAGVHAIIGSYIVDDVDNEGELLGVVIAVFSGEENTYAFRLSLTDLTTEADTNDEYITRFSAMLESVKFI